MSENGAGGAAVQAGRGRPDGWSQRDVVLASLTILVKYGFASSDRRAVMSENVSAARQQLYAELGITEDTPPGEIDRLLREAL